MEELFFDGWYIDGNFAIRKDKFEERFDGLYSYDELIKHERCTPAWKNHFDDWKERGILI